MNLSQLFVGTLAVMSGAHRSPASGLHPPGDAALPFHALVPAEIGNGELAPSFDLPAMLMDVEDAVYRCWDHGAKRRVPDQRKAVLCTVRAALSLCDNGADPWCGEAVRRTVVDGQVVAAGAPGIHFDPLSGHSPAAGHRSLDALLARAGPEFKASTVFQDSMDALEIEFGDLTAFDTSQPGIALTAADLLQVLNDSDSGEMFGNPPAGSTSWTLARFELALKAQGITLHNALKSIASEHVQSEPEHYAEALLDRLERWLDQRFPRDTDVALGAHRRHHLLGLLADHINLKGGQAGPR